MIHGPPNPGRLLANTASTSGLPLLVEDGALVVPVWGRITPAIGPDGLVLSGLWS